MSVNLAWGQTKKGDAPDPVEEYLLKFGLNEYVTDYLEGEFRKSGAEALARRLANSYAFSLLEIAETARIERVQKRIGELLDRFPGIRTPQIDTLLLQGDFFRAEADFAKWVFDPGDSVSKENAGAAFSRIAAALSQNAALLEQSLKVLEKEIGNMREGPALASRTAHARRLGQQFGRAAFFAGWSHYYLGQLRSVSTTDAQFYQAKLIFTKLLSIEKADKNIDLEELGMVSANRARALLGLALTERSMGNDAESDIWFDLLGDGRINEEVRESRDFWRLFGLIRARQSARALDLARAKVESPGLSLSQSNRNFCNLLVATGAREKGPWEPMVSLGIRGLIALRLADAAVSLSKKHGIALGPETPEGALILAVELLDKARKSKVGDDYKQAADAFELAVAKLSHSNSQARAQYQWAFCLAKCGDWGNAMKALEPAVSRLRHDKSDLAPDAAWLLLSVYERELARDPLLKRRFVTALQDFARDYPNHERAKTVAGLLALHDESSSAAPPLSADDPAYIEKLHFQVKKSYLSWRSKPGRGLKEVETARFVTDSATKFLDLPSNSTPAALRLEEAFMGADVWLGMVPPRADLAEAFLKKVEKLVEALGNDARAAADYRLLQLQLAQAKGDLPAATSAARWLSDNRDGTPLVETGFAIRARIADGQMGTRNDNESRALALAAYKDLTEHLGYSPEKLKASRNAQIAASRFAHLLFETNRCGECRTLLEEHLLKAFPREAKYLRLMGLLCNESKETDRALEYWRILTAGLRSGSAGWYEAKYHHMANLALKSKEDARLAFHQFKVLHPDMGADAFGKMFADLEVQLSR